jgi:predicted membrane protein
LVINRCYQALATIISLIYYFVATYSQPFLYQYWAILSLDIFCLIFWLISFALLAAEVAVAAAYSCSGYYDYYGDYVSSGCSRGSSGAIGLFGACAGIGGILL